MEKYFDVSLSAKERAEDLLSRLSLDEKIRQIGCAVFVPGVPKEFLDVKGGIGSATVIGAENPAETIRECQDYIMENSPHRIPALFHCEALAGPVYILGGNQYPISIGLGATFEPEIVKEMADATRKQMVANGFRHALSPVSDLARDLRWGRCNETYGNDPTLSAQMTVAFVKGLQGNDLKEGVAACGKHFLAYSQTEAGMNCHKTVADERDIREVFAKPFEAAIHMADMKTVMASYAAINGRPVSASKTILTGLLREELGFEGLTVSDYSAHNQVIEMYKIAETPVEAGITCLKAGLDTEYPMRVCYNNDLNQAVEEGRIDIDYINRSALRVLTLKFELGLFENPYPHEEMLPVAMDNTENDRNSYKAARKSITLMKNEGILPIKDNSKKIAVIGPAGNCLRMMFSHYTGIATMEMMANLATEGDTQQGFHIAEMTEEVGTIDGAAAMDGVMSGMSEKEISDKYALDGLIRSLYPQAKTVFEALQESFADITFLEGCDYKGNDDSHIAEAAELANRADIVILCIGGKSGLGKTATSGEGVDSATLRLPGQQEKLMKEIYRTNKNMVVVHTDGCPLVSEWAYENVPAIIEAWLPNTFGGNAIADVLTGKYNPGGRVPVDVPRSAGHVPVYHYQDNGSSALYNPGMIDTGYADSHSSVLAPFGYGLSYTEFAYSDISLHDLENGNIEITVSVKNTGGVDGEEVVQLYGTDLIASMIRPVHELIGFKRVALCAGEEKQVVFRFNIDIMSFQSESGVWITEKGKFRFVAGGNSADERCEVFYELYETKEVNPNKRCFFAAVDAG